jgi:putative heme iron utilization protein
MSTSTDPAYAARQLWAGGFHAQLSTLSQDEPGYPFGSLAPYVLDLQGRPLLLLSHLSQHTRNVDTDDRCGLLVTQHGTGDVQQMARLSAMGHLRPAADPGGQTEYFACFPHAREYHEALNFRFYRFEPLRMHWNGGFATARWLDPGRVLRANPFAPEVIERITTHMNDDHAAALDHYWAAAGGPTVAGATRMTAIDAEGMSLRRSETLLRVTFPRPVGTAAEARAVLVEMASAAEA